MKIGLVTDSACNLNPEILKKYMIEMIPLNIHFGEVVYKDIVDIKQEKFFDKLAVSEKLPTTSQPSVGYFLEKYKEMASNYDAVISIHLSSKLSGTYESAMIAARQIDNLQIKVIDTLSASLGIGFLVVLAAQLIKKDYKLDEVVNKVLEARNNISVYFIVNDLTYLQKGGRIGKAQAFLGSVLNFYPILGLPGDSGEVIPIEKVRGKKKITRKLVEITKKELKGEKNASLGLIHSTEMEYYNQFIKQIDDMINNIDIKYTKIEDWISAVLGCHVGPSVYGIVIFKGEILDL